MRSYALEVMASGEDDSDAMVMGWQFLAGRLPIRIITCTTSACIRARRKAARGPERHDSASLRVTTAPPLRLRSSA